MSDDLKPFNPSAYCLKCGDEDIHTRYHAGVKCSKDSCHECHERRCRGPQAEHMTRTCRRCGFCWLEAPLPEPPRRNT